jgi:hypothetical protein
MKKARYVFAHMQTIGMRLFTDGRRVRVTSPDPLSAEQQAFIDGNRENMIAVATLPCRCWVVLGPKQHHIDVCWNTSKSFDEVKEEYPIAKWLSSTAVRPEDELREG